MVAIVSLVGYNLICSLIFASRFVPFRVPALLLMLLLHYRVVWYGVVVAAAAAAAFVLCYLYAVFPHGTTW